MGEMGQGAAVVNNAAQRNVVESVETLLGGWSKVIRVRYRQLRRDGRWQAQDRDLLDRGHGVTVLLHDRARGTVLLLRQPRIIATLNGSATGETIEACNGLIERDETAAECARREVLQEVGHRVEELRELGAVYASPGASLEVVHLFYAEYADATRMNAGGGEAEEGEDIEVFEVTVRQALDWVLDGTICDGRTVLALQYARMRGLLAE